MKKLFFSLICLISFGGSPAYAEDEPIDLEVSIFDDTPNFPDKGKMPLRMPRVYKDGYTLTLSNYHPEYIINIIQDDVVVYSSVISAGVTKFDLPEYLKGQCTIQLISGKFCFNGLIAL